MSLSKLAAFILCTALICCRYVYDQCVLATPGGPPTVDAYLESLLRHAVSFPLLRHALTPLMTVPTPTEQTSSPSVPFFAFRRALLQCSEAFLIATDGVAVSWNSIARAAASTSLSCTAAHIQTLMAVRSSGMEAPLRTRDTVERMLYARCCDITSHVSVEAFARANPCPIVDAAASGDVLQALSWAIGAVVVDFTRFQSLVSAGFDPATGAT